ncbi:class I SAM-dependent methyltransferase [Bacillus sp. FJAT-47783]|uniref:class I SAM-dependent methyltransferase n=1 Tax=Bacillus sp. FJAT-47783 TaxID=2922712 RepID=UPI001FACECE0|nr:class I SAM-dependent methyltransferase [Bacillus sp. FJAT-47783]
MTSPYLNMLASLGVGGAHPGGLAVTKQLIDYINLKNNVKMIDIGCGTGQTVQYLHNHGFTVVGIDANNEMITRARKRFTDEDPILLYQMDIENLKQLNQSFQFALCESVLSFTNLSHSLEAIYHVLEECGTLVAIEMVMTKPLTDKEKKELQSFYGFQHFYTREEWIAFFQKEKYHVMDVIHPDEWIIEETEPMTEFDLSGTVQEEHFELLSKHEQLTKKYEDKLNYAIFICKK